MRYIKIHQSRLILYGIGGFLLLLTLIAAISALTNTPGLEGEASSGPNFLLPAFLFLLTGAYCGLIGYVFRKLYGRWRTARAYEVAFTRKEGDYGIDSVKANYLAKNLIYMLAIQNPSQRFSVVISKSNNCKPILVTNLSKEKVVSFSEGGAEFEGINIRLNDVDVRSILSDQKSRFIYCFPKDEAVVKETEIISFPDMLEKGEGNIERIFLNLMYEPAKDKKSTPVGNIVVQCQTSDLDVLEIISRHIRVPFNHLILSNHAFCRLYQSLYRTMVKIVISETIVETEEMMKFPPVKNYPEEFLTSANHRKWIVAASGEKFDSPVYLRKNTLVLQNYPGLTNPATVWMNTMIKLDNHTSFIALDLDGSISASAKAMNKDYLLSKDLAIIKAPTDTPEYIINLLGMWYGVSGEYRPEMLGALLAYAEKLVRNIFADESKDQQDQLVVILQGSILLTILNNDTNFDLATFSLAIKELPTPMNFLKNVHRATNALVYRNDDAKVLRQAWLVMNEAGQGVDYNQTIARLEPTSAHMASINLLYRRLSAFISEPGNLILSNGDSRYNLNEYRNIIFDVSAWDGRPESLMLEYVLTGMFYAQFLRRKLGFKSTNLLIGGISRLNEDAQKIALRMIRDHILETEGDDTLLIVADKQLTAGYKNLFLSKLFNDLYIFRLQEADELRELLYKAKILNSIYTLPKQNGYIFRFSSDKTKLVPGSVFTAKPQLVS